MTPGVMLYLGPGATAGTQKHHALQLVWSPEKPVLLESPAGTFETHAALISANRELSLSATGQRIVVLLLERHSPWGRALEQTALCRDSLDLANQLQDVPFPKTSLSSRELMQSCETLMGALGHVAMRKTLSTRHRVRRGSITGDAKFGERRATCFALSNSPHA
jgi:hypothetical protein